MIGYFTVVDYGKLPGKLPGTIPGTIPLPHSIHYYDA